MMAKVTLQDFQGQVIKWDAYCGEAQMSSERNKAQGPHG